MLETIDVSGKLLAGNWQKFRDFVWHDQPDDADEYMIVYTHGRDSGLMAKSNAAVIAKTLEGFDDVIPQHHRHWACGWVDGYAIRVYRAGEVTEAFRAYCDIQDRLNEYAVLDEGDYSSRQHNAALENIRNGANSEGKGFVLPENFAEETYSWLWDNNDSAVQDTDDDGAYPSAEALQEAWRALGYSTYQVKYIDVGRTIEEFDNEKSAIERVAELRQLGFDASYNFKHFA